MIDRRSAGRAGPAVPARAGARSPDSGPTRDRGASTLELALYMPILLFAIFVCVQFGLLFLGNQAASAAAREAARTARSGGGGPDAITAAIERGRDYAASIGRGVLLGVQVQVQPVAPDQVRATVTGHGIEVVPGMPGLRITQVSQGPVEGFRADV